MFAPPSRVSKCSRQFAAVVFTSVLLAAMGCSPAPNVGPSQTPTDDRSSVAGPRDSDRKSTAWSFVEGPPLPVETTYRSGEKAGRNAIVESLGGGVGVLDFDQDGMLDLVLPGGGGFVEKQDALFGLPTNLLRGDGTGRFKALPKNGQLLPSKYYTHGVAVGDFNNDGFPDFVVTGYGGLQLLVNLGDGLFEDVAVASGMIDADWSSSAGWGDLNGDGDLDLYVAHYVDWTFENNPVCLGLNNRPDVCPPRQFNGISDVVFLSQGDGRFQPVREQIGLVPGGKGLGVLLADIDQDGDLDVYVANDTENNFYYVNDGTGQLSESAVAAGVAADERGTANGSMGVSLTDYDGDGQFDIWVANYEEETFALYRQVSPGQFLHASQQAGIASLGTLNVGFGTAMVDFDADGDDDAVVANGHVIHFPRSGSPLQKVMLLENQGNERFVRKDLLVPDYLKDVHAGRGVAVGDFNLDGSVDFVISNVEEPSQVLLNTTPPQRRCEWIRLIGTRQNRDGIGAVIQVLRDGRKQVFSKFGGGSYLSSSGPLVAVNFPSAATGEDEITVIWSRDHRETYDLEAAPGKNFLQTVVEGRGNPRDVSRKR